MLRLPVLDPTKPRKMVSSYRAGLVIIQDGDVYEENGRFIGPAPDVIDGLTVEAIKEKALAMRPKDFPQFEGPPPDQKRRGRPRKNDIAPLKKEGFNGVGHP